MSHTRLRGYDTVAESAKFYHVTKTRMHKLLRIYGVGHVSNGHGWLVLRKELRKKIPRKRPVGVHIHNR